MKTNKIDFNKLRAQSDASFFVLNVEEMTNSDFIKALRKKLNMTQATFAYMLGITKKTIEKWEQGKNPVKGTAARLLYMIDKNPECIKDFYQFYSFEEVNYEAINEDFVLENASFETNKPSKKIQDLILAAV